MAQEQKQLSGRPKDVANEMASSIPTNFQESFSKVITAGMRVMFSEETHDMMIEQLEQEGDLAQNVGMAIAGLMLLLFKKSNNTMPAEIIVPAGIYLLAQGADFIEKVTGEEITPEIVATATQVMVETIADKFGVKKEQLMSGVEAMSSAGGAK
jgi:hypothetical protein